MEKNVQIWIDADSCPNLVRSHVVKIGAQLNLQIYFVANRKIDCSFNAPYKMIICTNEKDSADNYILQNAKENDLVITRDIVFADRLLEKNITCINDRGTIFTKNNIKPLLSSRNFDLELSNLGLVEHHKEGYDKKKFALFANAFDKTIHKLLKK